MDEGIEVTPVDNMQYVRVPGYEWRVQVTGEGPPLLLLHGFTGTHASWDHVVSELRADFTCVSVDLPGHGQTRTENGLHMDMQHTSEGLVQLMQELHFQTFSVLGYSMGGRLALYMGVMHPVVCSKLILESASPGLSTEAERLARRMQDENLAQSIEIQGVSSFVSDWEKIPLFQSQTRLSDESLQRQRGIRLAQTPAGLSASLRGMGTGSQPSLWERIGELCMPTLLITGNDDTKFTNIAKDMIVQIPNAEHHMISQAGHVVHMEQFDPFIATVRSFLMKS